MKKFNRLLLSFFVLVVVLSSTLFFKSAVGAGSSDASPVVAINVSEYTEANWNNTAWHYFAIYRMLEEAFKSDGTPFVEVSDANIESGGLMVSGVPKYPILFSLASECISDSEANQISSYVSAGGFVYVGSSSWTRYANGSARTNFALSAQMGVTCSNLPPNDWAQVQNATRIADNRLVNHVPKNVNINWQLPLTDNTVSSLALKNDLHYAWAAKPAAINPALVLITIDGNVMLAVKQYSSGMFIYHSELAPLASYSIYSPVAYEYMFFKQAVEWAFENQHVPLAKLSAWPYQYDSAFIMRHDLDISYASVPWIVSSAAAEQALGVTGQYYVVTGDVRDAANNADLISLIQQAQSLGAQIGSHNGGLNCTPWDPSLQYGDYLYYHWSPDEAMTNYPTGTADGINYANTSISMSLDDLQSWLGQRPDIWVSPNGQANLEESLQILASLGIKTSGEFTPSPYPGFAFSLSNETKSYAVYEVPFSRWISSSGTVYQSMEDLAASAPNDMQQLVDFYYNMGALVSPYSHSSSESGLPNQFLQDVLAKPYMWNTTPLELRDWGVERQQVQSTEQFKLNANGVNNLTVTLTGSSSPNTALDIVLPVNDSQIMNLQVLLDGTPTTNYRLTDSGLKVQAGMSSKVTVLYSISTASSWVQTNQADFKAGTLTNLNPESGPGQLTLGQTSLFSDDFSNASWTSSHWTVLSGNWTVNNGYYNMTSQPQQLALAYTSGSSWSDFTVETKVQYISGDYTGELNARVDPNVGSRYSLLFSPNLGGPNKVLLVKLSSWQDTTGALLGQASVSTDTNWHIVRMELSGNTIKCYYDGNLVFNIVDSSYASGRVGFESWGNSSAAFDWVNVTTLTYSSPGTLLSSAYSSPVDSADWKTLSWTASTPAGTNVTLNTRTAATQSGLASASWSNNYTASGSTITSPSNKWIQYQATLTTNNALITPTLYDVTITYTYVVPTQNGTLYLTVNMSMTATVGQLEYTEANITKQIRASWIANDGTLYAGSNETLLKSLDQGLTWRPLLTFNGSAPVDIARIYVNNLNYLFASPSSSAAANELGLWRSIDNGQTWTNVLPLPLNCSISSIAEDSNGNLFAGIYTTGTIGNASICKSVDGGANWSTVYYDSGARHVHYVTVDKSNNYVYAAIGDVRVNPSWHAYVIRSTDDGGSNSSWGKILDLPQILSIQTVDAKLPNGTLIPVARLLATDYDNGQIYRTTDDANFSLVLDTGAQSYGYWIRTNDLNGNIYASFVGGENPAQWVAGIWMSANNGTTWTVYKTFAISNAYFGSSSASNFLQGTMYYSLQLDSGWQNGVKIYPIYIVTQFQAFSQSTNDQNLVPQTVNNDSDAQLAANSSDSSVLPDQQNFSSNQASWVPVGLGTVFVSTGASTNLFKLKSSQIFAKLKVPKSKLPRSR